MHEVAAGILCLFLVDIPGNRAQASLANQSTIRKNAANATTNTISSALIYTIHLRQPTSCGTPHPLSADAMGIRSRHLKENLSYYGPAPEADAGPINHEGKDGKPGSEDVERVAGIQLHPLFSQHGAVVPAILPSGREVVNVRGNEVAKNPSIFQQVRGHSRHSHRLMPDARSFELLRLRLCFCAPHAFVRQPATSQCGSCFSARYAIEE